MARLGPSGLAQLFREIANYVSTRLSNYNTKDELDSILDTKADDNNVVHTSGEETINGVKTFTDQVYLGAGGTGYGLISAKDNNSILRLFGGTSPSTGANLDLYGEGLNDGGFSLRARTSDKIVSLDAKVDGTLKWNGKNVALDENLVHTSGDETINGTKTFSSGPWVTNNHNTTGFSIKNTALARNDIPTEYQHYTFRAYDKNNNIMGEYCIEKATTGDALLSMNVRSEDSSGTQISYGMQFRMTNDGSLVRFFPSANNKVHLGDPNAKWLKVHSDDVVHTSGNETIGGNKTFTNQVYLGAGGTIMGVLHFKSGGRMTSNNDATWKSLDLWSGSTASNGATLHLRTIDSFSQAGTFVLSAKKADGTHADMFGSPDGTLTWNGKNVAIDENLVHTSGNETIGGVKIFTDTIYKKNSTLDLQVNPSSDQFNSFIFMDKNNVTMSYLEHIQTTTGVNALGLITRDKNNGSHGIQVTSEDNVIPLGNGVVNLGLSGSKWKNVYATTFNGNLKGNADTATSAGNGVDSYGKGWIRFKNGIQMCWGSGNNSNTATSIVVNFARTFASPPVISAQCYNPAHYICWVSTKYSNYFTLNFDIASTVAYEWFAIGTWK